MDIKKEAPPTEGRATLQDYLIDCSPMLLLSFCLALGLMGISVGQLAHGTQRKGLWISALVVAGFVEALCAPFLFGWRL